jgi:hypothetical protein
MNCSYCTKKYGNTLENFYFARFSFGFYAKS